MFEQSILLDQPHGKKAGALAASITVQTIIVGTLLVIPLIYNERLPGVHLWTSITAPIAPLAAPEPVQTARPAPPTRASLTLPRIFRPIDVTSHAQQTVASTIIANDFGLPDASANLLPQGVNVDVQPLQNLIGVVHPIEEPVVKVQTSPEKPRVVGGDVQAAKLIKKVVPAYPALARQARISGTVRLRGIIAKDGTIQKLEVLSGHPLLVNAAIEAVRQWVYRPTLLNDQPVEVIAPIDVIFNLSR